MRASATVAATWSDTSFPAMGSTARLLVLGGARDLPDRARARVEDLEARWSRFRPTSELCRLNAANDVPVIVSAETFDVIVLAVAAWRATAGAFDPTVLAALEALGYDRDFTRVVADADVGNEADTGAPRPVPGCAGIELDPLPRAVRLPPGVRLDLGGIGKGRAADLVAEELMAAGAEGVCVNLGGDVRLAGTSPERTGWTVDLDPALAPARSFRLGEGAVATSTRLKRTWTRHGRAQHHLVDPRTGQPVWSGLAAVTVLARTTAWAEVLAKAALLAGPVAGPALLGEQGGTGLLVHDDGRVEDLPGLTEFVRT